MMQAQRMEKKNDRRALASYDADDVNNVARSQLRKRFDLGGSTSSTTQPNFDSRGENDRSRNDRRTTRPRGESPPDSSAHKRPTIPTPRPRLGLACVPRRLVDDNQMLKLPLDHRAAFVLMHIDGKTSLRTLIDVAGMPADEVVVLVERLVELRAVSVL